LASRHLTAVSFLYTFLIGTLLGSAVANAQGQVQGQSFLDPEQNSYIDDMYRQYEAPLSKCDQTGTDSDMSAVVPNRNEYKMGLTGEEFVKFRFRYLQQETRTLARGKRPSGGSCMATFRNIEKEFQHHISTRNATLLRLFQDADVQKDFPKKCGEFLNDKHCPSGPSGSADPLSQPAFRGFACIWRQVIYRGRPLVVNEVQRPARRGPSSVGEIAEQSELQTSACAVYIERLDQSIKEKPMPGSRPIALVSHSSRPELMAKTQKSFGGGTKTAAKIQESVRRIPQQQRRKPAHQEVPAIKHVQQ